MGGRSEILDLQLRYLVPGRKRNVANERLEEIQQQSVKLAKAAPDWSRQLTESSGRAQALRTETTSSRWQLGEVGRVRNDTTVSADGKGQAAEMLESRIRLLKELNLLKRKGTPVLDMNIVGRMVVDAKGGGKKLNDRLHRDTSES